MSTVTSFCLTSNLRHRSEEVNNYSHVNNLPHLPSSSALFTLSSSHPPFHSPSPVSPHPILPSSSLHLIFPSPSPHPFSLIHVQLEESPRLINIKLNWTWLPYWCWQGIASTSVQALRPCAMLPNLRAPLIPSLTPLTFPLTVIPPPVTLFPLPTAPPNT